MIGSDTLMQPFFVFVILLSDLAFLMGFGSFVLCGTPAFVCNLMPQSAGGAISCSGGILPDLELAGMAQPYPHSYRETILFMSHSWWQIAKVK
jgi:hypothetical protein